MLIKAKNNWNKTYSGSVRGTKNWKSKFIVFATKKNVVWQRNQSCVTHIL